MVQSIQWVRDRLCGDYPVLDECHADHMVVIAGKTGTPECCDAGSTRR
jgi:hypothetical protein